MTTADETIAENRRRYEALKAKGQGQRRRAPCRRPPGST